MRPLSPHIAEKRGGVDVRRILIMALSPLDRIEDWNATRDDKTLGEWPKNIANLILQYVRKQDDGSPQIAAYHPRVTGQLKAAFDLPLAILGAGPQLRVWQTNENRANLQQALETLGLSRLSLDEVQENLKQLTTRPAFPWLQNLTVISHHARTKVADPIDPRRPFDIPRPILETVLVLTSRKSHGDFPLFAALSSALLRAADRRAVHVVEAPCGRVDFESYDDVDRAIRDTAALAKQNLGVKDRDIVVDITSGQRPFAVAAAVATMNNAMVFSYVATDTRALRQYDGGITLSQ